jgi:SAM-dependent MidA family methyltransferase
MGLWLGMGLMTMADNPEVSNPSMTAPPSLTSEPASLIRQAIGAAGGWIGFDSFMAMALYAPGYGYYSRDSAKFGIMPAGLKGGGGDFVTAPELSPHFGRALARQLAQALEQTQTNEIWEFGAGSGALARQLLTALGDTVKRYSIVDLSGSLRELQRSRLQAFAGKVHWVTELPEKINGVVVGNEVLDAMPVKLLARIKNVWHERGVAIDPAFSDTSDTPRAGFVYADQPTGLRPPVEVEGQHDYVTEIHPQAEGFVRTLADRLETGAAFLLDYGFPEREYYHPQRSMGTVMCHRGHMADTDALADVGSKDITAHVNFTGIALAAQEAGLQVLGYTSQGRFLLNCGLLDGLEDAPLQERVMVQRLVAEHEMGELFKVIALAADRPEHPYIGWQAMGFAQGDRSGRL